MKRTLDDTQVTAKVQDTTTCSSGETVDMQPMKKIQKQLHSSTTTTMMKEEDIDGVIQEEKKRGIGLLVRYKDTIGCFYLDNEKKLKDDNKRDTMRLALEMINNKMVHIKEEPKQEDDAYDMLEGLVWTTKELRDDGFVSIIKEPVFPWIALQNEVELHKRAWCVFETSDDKELCTYTQ